MKVVFLTDGGSRRILVGKREIIFRRSTPRNMAAAGRLGGLVVQALRYRGPEAVDEMLLRRLRVDELKAACAECARNEVAPVLASHLHSTAGLPASDVIFDEADQDGQTLLVRYKSIVGPKIAAYVMPSAESSLVPGRGMNQSQNAMSERYLTRYCPAAPGQRLLGFEHWIQDARSWKKHFSSTRRFIV